MITSHLIILISPHFTSNESMQVELSVGPFDAESANYACVTGRETPSLLPCFTLTRMGVDTLSSSPPLLAFLASWSLGTVIRSTRKAPLGYLYRGSIVSLMMVWILPYCQYYD